MASKISGASGNALDAILLYAGPPTTPTETTSTSEGASPQPRTVTDVVQISDAAKAASAKLQAESSAAQPSLKARVDKLFQEARDRGTFITFDTSKGGERMNYSSFTDDELAQIANDKGGEYSEDLSGEAEAALAYRMKVTLEPYENSVFDGDRRGQAMTINKLFDQMSPDVRQALHWTPAMMVSNNEMLDRDTKLYGQFDEDTVTANLLSAAKRGALSYHAPPAAPKKRSATPNPAHDPAADGAAPAAPR